MGNGTDVNAHLLEPVGQSLVFFHKQLARNGERLVIGDSNTLLELGLDAGILEELVQLGAGAVNDDGVQANVVKERKTVA